MALSLAEQLREGFLDLVAPTRCAGCEYPGVLLCPACAARMERIDPVRACPRCGAPECVRRCHECRDRAFAFAAGRSAVVFDGPAPRVVVLHKDASERRLSAVMAHRMAAAAEEWGAWADAVVGVPAAPAAVVRRGYDHGADLAAAVAAELGIPVARPLRCTTARDQRGLGRAGRSANACFTAEAPLARRVLLGAPGPERASVLPPAHVLLVDDVFTTGATTHAAATALLEAGAREVRVLAFARVLRA